MPAKRHATAVERQREGSLQGGRYTAPGARPLPLHCSQHGQPARQTPMASTMTSDVMARSVTPMPDGNPAHPSACKQAGEEGAANRGASQPPGQETHSPRATEDSNPMEKGGLENPEIVLASIPMVTKIEISKISEYEEKFVN